MIQLNSGLWRVGVLVASLGLLAGCDDASNAQQAGNEADTSGAGSGELAGLLESVPSGESTLSISGAATSTGEYTTADDPRYGGVSNDNFRPARGGGASRRGSNAEGPYAISIYTDATHEDDPDNVVRAWVSLVLPEGAEAGNRYQVASFSDADDDQAQAHVRGDGMAWTFSRQVSGSVYLDEYGEHVSAAWQLEAADGRGEDASRVASEGAVKDLPLTLQSEVDYEMTVNGETESRFARANSRDNMLNMGNGVYFYLPSGASAGSYPVQAGRDDDAVRVRFTQHEVDEVSGELTLVANGERFDAEFSIDASGEDDVHLAGNLRWLALEDE
ncbi:hypothetical protein SAMN05192555_108152 [Franzmannia pantelleriensis]|uniref:Uncharacterized protein n=1 Tax=Franzmannia pantelleriensis TaxID=48727 RepID=A0A1G9PMG2_9GAMM|nr:hypothetical protein [Halomonas pantelleriensis]SDL99894.1 hypothetical protein SAMN05192555_108152 [Halomonas pantelleriensis]